MPNPLSLNLDYDRPVKIEEDIYWIGFCDVQSGLHCNPYLIVDGEEAVVIDGGSRPDFPTVMMKILQTGTAPDSIMALIYQHYDPDLCGSIPNFEDIIGKDDLKIISDKENNVFIRHYSVSSKLLSLKAINYEYRFSSGRKLIFINTPYAHSAGSFITLDEKTGVLFTSDLFGSFALKWDLFLKLETECGDCSDYQSCPKNRSYCPFPDMFNFHRKIMTSCKALEFALKRIGELPFKIIAPQHGSVITERSEIELVLEKLATLEEVGIDGVVESGR